MKLTTTWAVLGSLVINVVLGLLIAALFSVAPPAKAAELAARATQSQARPTPSAPSRKQDYLVAVRMGWAS